MIGLLLVSSLLEGISIVLFLPVLEVLFSDASSNDVTRYVLGLFEYVGLTPTLVTLLGFLVCVSTGRAIVLWLSKCQVGYAVIRIGTDLRLALVHALRHVRWGYFVRQQPGALANSLSFECETASNVYFHSARLYASSLSLFVNLALAAFISWYVSLVVVLACVVGLVCFSSLLRLAHSAGLQQNRVLGRVTSFLVDFLNGFKPLKSMGKEDLFTSVMSHEIKELNRAKGREVLAKESLVALQEPFTVVLLACGVAAVHSFSLVSGSKLLVVLYLFYRMMSYFSEIQQAFQNVYRCRGVYESLMEKIEGAESQRANSGSGTVIFDNEISAADVNYAYGDREVLTGASFTIKAGEFVAITGPTGAGKTTIVDLVSGLIEPAKGQVSIDGVELSKLDLLAWRQLIGYVPQEVFLFNDTISANLTLGEDISEDSQWEALRLAGIEGHVRSLADGLDTPIGEHGRALSGGQRQRVMIARALVRNPKLLILDEATTGLDTKTEKEIIDSLVDLKGRVTILAISHQPGLREAADLVLHMKDGRIKVVK